MMNLCGVCMCWIVIHTIEKFVIACDFVCASGM